MATRGRKPLSLRNDYRELKAHQKDTASPTARADIRLWLTNSIILEQQHIVDRLNITNRS